MKLTYTRKGDYYIPNLTPPDNPEHPIGRFGRMRLKYLKEHQNERFETLITAYAKADGTDEHLKARDQLRWVGQMNNHRHCAEEVVRSEIICIE